MRRREFLGVVGGAAAVWPVLALAQQAAMPVVGFLRDASPQGSEHFVAGFRRGLGEAGFVEGRNVAVEYALTDGETNRLPAMAADLVQRRVSVILASAINAAKVAKTATSTIPIVFAIANDAVAFGLVASLSRPGGNLTGVSYLTSELGGKRLGLMHELMPKVMDFAVIANPNNPNATLFISDVETAARTAALRIEVVHAASEGEFDAAFAALAARRTGAVLIANDPLFTTRRERIIALAGRYAIPTIYTTREFAESGGLISYGPNLADVYRLAGNYVGRILRGDKPTDLPVLLPTTFEMILNIKTSKALGLDMPATVLARADEIIE
jgi:putative ABC transport system substrate-binding protein